MTHSPGPDDSAARMLAMLPGYSREKSVRAAAVVSRESRRVAGEAMRQQLTRHLGGARRTHERAGIRRVESAHSTHAGRRFRGSCSGWFVEVVSRPDHLTGSQRPASCRLGDMR
jgi:hypothetical protein